MAGTPEQTSRDAHLAAAAQAVACDALAAACNALAAALAQVGRFASLGEREWAARCVLDALARRGLLAVNGYPYLPDGSGPPHRPGPDEARPGEPVYAEAARAWVVNGVYVPVDEAGVEAAARYLAAGRQLRATVDAAVVAACGQMVADLAVGRDQATRTGTSSVVAAHDLALDLVSTWTRPGPLPADGPR